MGPIFPSTCSNSPVAGGGNWVNPSSGTIEDGNNATDTSATSAYLYCSGYNFNIPSNAVITGVVFGVKKLNVTNQNIDNSVRLFELGTAVGNDKADGSTTWPTPLTWINYGNSADLWGLVLNPATVNDNAFGAAISAVKGSGGGTSYAIDAEEMTIFFNSPTTIYGGTIRNGTFR